MKPIDFSKFNTPGDLLEAQGRIATASSEIETINEQLKNRTEPKNGQSQYDLSVWRKRAMHARDIKQAEIKFLKHWIAEERAATGHSSFPSEVSASGLLLAVLPVLNVAAENGLVRGSNEKVLLAVRGFVANQFPSISGLVTGTVTLEDANAEH